MAAAQPESELVRRARELQAALYRRDTATVEQLLRRYLQLERALEGRILALAEQMVADQARGIQPRIGRLYQMQRFHDLQAQLLQEFRSWDAWVVAHVEAARMDAGYQGILSAESLAGLTSLSGSFNRLPAEAIRAMILNLLPETPLARLLAAAYVDAADAFASALVEGVGQGLNPRAVADQASRALGIGLDRALTIARTEQLRAYRMGELARIRELGVTRYKRMAAHDSRVCLGCLAADGTEYATEDFDAHPNCRCKLVPFDPEGEVPSWESSEAWFNAQPEAVRLHIMGPGRMELYSSGQATWGEMYRRTWSDEWGGAIVPALVRDLRAAASGTQAA